MVKMKCLIKVEKDPIALNNGPAIFIQGKRRAKKKSPRVQEFLIKRHCLT